MPLEDLIQFWEQQPHFCSYSYTRNSHMHVNILISSFLYSFAHHMQVLCTAVLVSLFVDGQYSTST